MRVYVCVCTQFRGVTFVVRLFVWFILMYFRILAGEILKIANMTQRWRFTKRTFVYQFDVLCSHAKGLGKLDLDIFVVTILNFFEA